MKKMILSLIAMVLAAPVMATEPSDLNGLGLAGLSVVSEDAGMEVRGLGAVASSSGLSTLRLFVIDPATGSTFNANASNFSVSSEDSAIAPVATGEDVLANSGSFAALTGLNVNIGGVGGFNFSVDGSAGSSGQGSTALGQDSLFTFGAATFSFVN